MTKHALIKELTIQFEIECSDLFVKSSFDDIQALENIRAMIRRVATYPNGSVFEALEDLMALKVLLEGVANRYKIVDPLGGA